MIESRSESRMIESRPRLSVTCVVERLARCPLSGLTSIPLQFARGLCAASEPKNKNSFAAWRPRSRANVTLRQRTSWLTEAFKMLDSVTPTVFMQASCQRRQKIESVWQVETISCLRWDNASVSVDYYIAKVRLDQLSWRSRGSRRVAFSTKMLYNNIIITSWRHDAII